MSAGGSVQPLRQGGKPSASGQDQHMEEDYSEEDEDSEY